MNFLPYTGKENVEKNAYFRVINYCREPYLAEVDEEGSLTDTGLIARICKSGLEVCIAYEGSLPNNGDYVKVIEEKD